MSDSDAAWTREPPTVPGWYWFRPNDGWSPTDTIIVRKIGTGDDGFITLCGSGGMTTMEDMRPGYWFGPLAAPRLLDRSFP